MSMSIQSAGQPGRFGVGLPSSGDDRPQDPIRPDVDDSHRTASSHLDDTSPQSSGVASHTETTGGPLAFVADKLRSIAKKFDRQG